jgi:uncharacterized protein
MKNLRWVILALFVAVCISFVKAEIQFPELKQRVNDFTNTLGFQEWQEVDRLLKSYEDTTSMQVIVLMINSLEGTSIEEYAGKIFVLNKIGQDKNNNGVLLLIAKQDQKVWIEAGHDLQSVLTNTISSQIISNEILPHFKVDNYFGGIVTGVDAIVRAAEGNYQLKENSTTLSTIIIFAAIFVFAVAIGVIMILRNRIQVKKSE